MKHLLVKYIILSKKTEYNANFIYGIKKTCAQITGSAPVQ